MAGMILSQQEDFEIYFTQSFQATGSLEEKHVQNDMMTCKMRKLKHLCMDITATKHG